MTDPVCTFERRDEVLVAYLYDDLEPAERARFGAHADGCAACRRELTDLRDVRADLARWAPPEPSRVLAFPAAAPSRSRLWSGLAGMPAWARAAAALLVLGVSLAIANVQVRYDAQGLTVRTGWAAFAGSEDAASASARPVRTETVPSPAAVPPFTQAAARAAWQADLATLEQRLRADLTPAALAPSRSAATGNDALLRELRGLIEASERNQRRELALRVAEVARDVQAQRAADLQRIQRNLNVIENTTGGAIVRQRQLLNNLAVLVSQQQ